MARGFDIVIICTYFLPGILWGCYWVPRHGVLGGNEITGKLARGDSVQKFVGPEPSLGVSRQNIRNNIIGWVDNRHLAMWRGPGCTQRQVRKLTAGRSPTTKTRLLSFNRTQSRAVTGLLTGHNTLRRHLYLMGLINNPTCWKCGTEEEISVHIRCECEALASPRRTYLGSFSLDPDNIKSLSVGEHLEL